MTTLSLREAAEQVGVSKSTIFRAIQSGRMSAPRTDDGGFAIDPAELFRVYPPKAEKAGNGVGRSEDRAEGRDASGEAGAAGEALRVRNAQLEAEVNALRTVLEMEKQRSDRERERADELRAERDRWAGLAEGSQRQLTHFTSQPAPATVRAGGGWWPWRRRA